MDAAIPKYRFSSVIPIQKSAVLYCFEKEIISTHQDDLLCIDGTLLRLHQSDIDDQYFVEFQCQFHAINRGVDFGLLPQCIKFCQEFGGSIKILRNGVIGPASDGFIHSDVSWSRAWKIALHLGVHPKDSKSRKLLASKQRI